MSWYSNKTRKPRLRIKILEILALEGNLSKRQIEFYLKNEAAGVPISRRSAPKGPHMNGAVPNPARKHSTSTPFPVKNTLMFRFRSEGRTVSSPSLILRSEGPAVNSPGREAGVDGTPGV